MRRIGVSVVWVSVLLLALPASAQDYPKAEIFGGFSFASVDDPIDIEREAFLGFQTSFAGNFNKSFGIVGDFGGHYRSPDVGSRAYEFMVGPRFTSRGDTATGFVHAMFGGVAFRGNRFSDTGFAMAFGGGVDVKVSKRFAFRVIQFDYVPTHLFDTWEHNIRFGIGVVFKLGGGS